MGQEQGDSLDHGLKRQGRAGEQFLGSASLNNSSRFWAVGVVSSCPLTSPGKIKGEEPWVAGVQGGVAQIG